MRFPLSKTSLKVFFPPLSLFPLPPPPHNTRRSKRKKKKKKTLGKIKPQQKKKKKKKKNRIPYLSREGKIYGPSQVKKCLRNMMRKKERIHIILRMCNVSYGRLLYIETFYSILSFCLQTTEALIGLCACAGWLGLRYLQMPRRHVCAWRGTYHVI